MAEFGSKALNTAIGRVEHAMGDDEVRPILSTILFEGDDKGFRLVASDNYRIAIATLSEDDHAGFGRVPVASEFIPTLRAFLKIYDRPVTLTTEQLRLIVSDGSGSVSLRVVDGTWPAYESLVPANGPVFGVNPIYIADATKAAKGLPAVKIHKANEEASPFVVEAENYREAIMAVRLGSIDG